MFEDTNFFPQDGSSQSIVGGGVESVNSKKPDLKGNVSLNLSDLSEDSTHRTVTDEEKKKWNNTGEGGGGVAPAVDTTLSHAGQAADAKAVGDKIKTLNESLAAHNTDPDAHQDIRDQISELNRTYEALTKTEATPAMTQVVGWNGTNFVTAPTGGHSSGNIHAEGRGDAIEITTSFSVRGEGETIVIGG